MWCHSVALVVHRNFHMLQLWSHISLEIIIHWAPHQKKKTLLWTLSALGQAQPACWSPDMKITKHVSVHNNVGLFSYDVTQAEDSTMVQTNTPEAEIPRKTK